MSHWFSFHHFHHLQCTFQTKHRTKPMEITEIQDDVPVIYETKTLGNGQSAVLDMRTLWSVSGGCGSESEELIASKSWALCSTKSFQNVFKVFWDPCLAIRTVNIAVDFCLKTTCHVLERVTCIETLRRHLSSLSTCPLFGHLCTKFHRIHEHVVATSTTARAKSFGCTTIVWIESRKGERKLGGYTTWTNFLVGASYLDLSCPLAGQFATCGLDPPSITLRNLLQNLNAHSLTNPATIFPPEHAPGLIQSARRRDSTKKFCK